MSDILPAPRKHFFCGCKTVDVRNPWSRLWCLDLGERSEEVFPDPWIRKTIRFRRGGDLHFVRTITSGASYPPEMDQRRTINVLTSGMHRPGDLWFATISPLPAFLVQPLTLPFLFLPNVSPLALTSQRRTLNPKIPSPSLGPWPLLQISCPSLSSAPSASPFSPCSTFGSGPPNGN